MSFLPRVALILAFFALLLGGCGGGREDPRAAEGAPGIRAALRAKMNALEQTGVSKEEAARQLMNWAEGNFKNYFPVHQETQSYPPFVFRYYPDTKVYLGVAVANDQTYPDGVYVMGGEFGDSPLFVGAVTKFITPTAPTSIRLDYRNAVRTGDAPSLILFAPTFFADGQVEINGVDTGRPTTPFVFDWGDGTVTNGFFPQRHTYRNPQGVYRASVTAQYAAGGSDSAEVYVVFGGQEIVEPQPYPAELAVTIPLQLMQMGSTDPHVPAPTNLQVLDIDAQLRFRLEYVMSQAARVQFDLLEGDIRSTEYGLRQVVFSNPDFGGAYSLWFTSPISFAMNPSFVNGSIGYSTLFHEMGHNFTLNSPRAFRYGDYVPGSANAIYTEFIAQVFQHVTAVELVNNRSRYGISEGIAVEILKSAQSSALGLRAWRDRYLAAGMPFTTWNDPGTPDDDALGTFMILAYQFLVHAEQQGNHFAAAQRMMSFFRRFNFDWATRYDQHHDTPAATAFRATLMVAALSHAFRLDLREEFRALRFVIDDTDWQLLAPETS